MNSQGQHAYYETFEPTETEIEWVYSRCPALKEDFGSNPLAKKVQLEHNQDGEIRVWYGIALRSCILKNVDHWEVATETYYAATELKCFPSTNEGLDAAFAQGKAWGWIISKEDYIRMNITPFVDKVAPPAPKKVRNKLTGNVYVSIAETRAALHISGTAFKRLIKEKYLEYID